jgi:hypothetical protein
LTYFSFPSDYNDFCECFFSESLNFKNAPEKIIDEFNSIFPQTTDIQNRNLLYNIFCKQASFSYISPLLLLSDYYFIYYLSLPPTYFYLPNIFSNEKTLSSSFSSCSTGLSKSSLKNKDEFDLSEENDFQPDSCPSSSLINYPWLSSKFGILFFLNEFENEFDVKNLKRSLLSLSSADFVPCFSEVNDFSDSITPSSILINLLTKEILAFTKTMSLTQEEFRQRFLFNCFPIIVIFIRFSLIGTIMDASYDCFKGYDNSCFSDETQENSLLCKSFYFNYKNLCVFIIGSFSCFFCNFYLF